MPPFTVASLAITTHQRPLILPIPEGHQKHTGQQLHDNVDKDISESEALWLVQKQRTGLEVSDQSGSQLKEYPRMVDPDQQMGTAQRNRHHPGAGAADP